MNAVLSKFSLATATLLLACSAQAAPTIVWNPTIDFETVNGQAVAAFFKDNPGVASVGAGSQYASQGVTFSDKFNVFPFSTAAGKPQTDARTGDGYLSNDTRQVSIDVDDALKIEHLSFQFSLETAPTVTLFGTTGNKSLTIVNGTWDLGWTELTDSFFSEIGYLDRIQFTMNSDAFFAVDNIRLGVTDDTLPVPEPGAASLVALGLVAVGLATRRRQVA
jgi:hypothetical protein